MSMRRWILSMFVTLLAACSQAPTADTESEMGVESDQGLDMAEAQDDGRFDADMRPGDDSGDGVDPDVGQPDLQAQTGWYVDATSGDDTSNDGRSADSPFASLSRVTSEALVAGDTIYLARGSVWFEQLTLDVSGVAIDAYGEGPPPRIDGSVSVPEWMEAGEGVYSATVEFDKEREGLGNLSVDGVLLTPIDFGGDGVATLDGAERGSYTFDWHTQTLFAKLEETPVGKDVRASTKLFGIQAAGLDDITVSNVEITRFSLHGVNFEDCDGCFVSDARIREGGGAVIRIAGPGNSNYLYAGNGVEFDHSTINSGVNGVTITDIFDSCVSPQTFVENVHGADQTYSNMTLARCGFAGVEVSVLANEGATGSSLSNIVIEDSLIEDMGLGWSGRRYGSEGHGIRVKADTGAGDIANTVIRNTTIHNSAGDGLHISGETGPTLVHASDIGGSAGAGVSFLSPSASDSALTILASVIHDNGANGVVLNCVGCASATMHHNTLVSNATINVAVFAQPEMLDARNNLIWQSQAGTELYALTPLTASVLDYNCYGEGLDAFGWGDDAFETRGAFSDATGFESSSMPEGSVDLADPGNHDFTLLDSSRCIGAGAPDLEIMTDIRGMEYRDPPSAGAYAR